MRNFTLTELIQPEVLQQLQDAFSEFTGMAALTTDAAGTPVTTGSNFSYFCTKVIRSSKEGCRQCEKCDKNGALMALNTKKPAIYRCHAGLVDFAAPIMVNDTMIGSFVAGQVLVDELDLEHCRKTAEEYGIDPDEYISAAQNSLRMSVEQVQKSAKLLFDITKTLSSFALKSFNDIEKSRSLELAARSQSSYIMRVFSGMTDDVSSIINSAKEAVEADSAEQMKSTLMNLINIGTESSIKIRDSVTYLKSLGKKIKVSDEEFSPKALFAAAFAGIRNKQPDDVVLCYEIDNSVPDLLLGDAGCSCQILDKIVQICASSGGRNIKLSITSSKRSYAQLLKFIITADCTNVLGQDIDKANALISAREDFIPSKNGDFDLSILRTLINKISGNAVVYAVEDGIEFKVSLPQLKIEGGEF